MGTFAQARPYGRAAGSAEQGPQVTDQQSIKLISIWPQYFVRRLLLQILARLRLAAC